MSDKHWAAFSSNTRQLGSLTVSYDNLYASGLIEEHLGLTVKKIVDLVGERLEELEAALMLYAQPEIDIEFVQPSRRPRTMQIRRLLNLDPETGKAALEGEN